jgi:hypothetical protein
LVFCGPSDCKALDYSLFSLYIYKKSVTARNTTSRDSLMLLRGPYFRNKVKKRRRKIVSSRYKQNCMQVVGNTS